MFESTYHEVNIASKQKTRTIFHYAVEKIYYETYRQNATDICLTSCLPTFPPTQFTISVDFESGGPERLKKKHKFLQVKEVKRSSLSDHQKDVRFLHTFSSCSSFHFYFFHTHLPTATITCKLFRLLPSSGRRLPCPTV